MTIPTRTTEDVERLMSQLKLGRLIYQPSSLPDNNFTSVTVRLSSGETLVVNPWWLNGSEPKDGDESRTSLLNRLENQEIEYVEYWAEVFAAVYPNANFYRFLDEELGPFAQSYAGQPFLRDHDQFRIANRDGKIVESRLDGNRFLHRHRLTTDRGIRSFIEGQIDRFSIGWSYDDILCSATGKRFDPWRDPWPGEEFIDDGEIYKCELIFINPKGIECSGVNVPAVDGTYILSNQMTRRFDMAEILARRLNERIDELTRDGSVDRATLIQRMADESGGDGLEPISTETVQQILRAEIDCPPIPRLTGFDRALELDDGTSLAWAQEDGCHQSESEMASSGDIVQGVTQALNEVWAAHDALVARVQQLEQDNQALRQERDELASAFESLETFTRQQLREPQATVTVNPSTPANRGFSYRRPALSRSEERPDSHAPIPQSRPKPRMNEHQNKDAMQVALGYIR